MSTDKFTDKSAGKYPWPQWQLTAFVLNELEQDVASEIQAAVERDKVLAIEIAAIRATCDQVTMLYKHELVGIVPTKFDAVQSTVQLADSIANDPVTRTKTAHQRFKWSAAAGLLAMCASLAVVVVLASPMLKSFFTSPQETLAIRTDSDVAAAIATAEDQVKELTEQVEAYNANVIERAAVHRTSSASPLGENAAATALGLPGGTNPDFDIDSVTSPTTAFERDHWGDAPVELKQQSVASGDANRWRERLSAGGAGIVSGERGTGMGSGSPGSPSAGMAGGGMRFGGPMGDKGSAAPAPTASPLSLNDGVEFMDAGSGSKQESLPQLASANQTRLESDVAEGLAKGGSSFSVLPLSVVAAESESLFRRQPEGTISLDAKAKESESKASSDRFLGRAARMYDQPNSDRYAPIYENPFKTVGSEPLSTFSIDVDTASYAKARQFLLQSRTLPPPNAVRVEEFLNYFDYEYAGPKGDDPFAAALAVSTCPWRPEHKLVRIALQAKKIDMSERPKANIVFLLDVSGSMDEPNKLPLVKESMRMLIQQLGENDRIAMVVYAGAAGCVLESTTGDKQDIILGALDRLNAGGSTNGGQGIQLAYDIARDHFIPSGINRVVLCTDGDFNVGTTSTEGLVNLVVENAKSKVFLTVLGYGAGNTNDAMMEQISDKGNGVYGFVDSRREAQRQMVKQLAGNLMTVAKDVKIQVEFNPARVASYRLIGYENRVMAKEDFANDKKDAGEIGAGHRVTALYEIEPIGDSKVQPVGDTELRYQKKSTTKVTEEKPAVNDEFSNELLTVNLRYKQPEGDTSKLLTFPLADGSKPFVESDTDFQWAATVAQFGMLLRNSTHKGSANWSSLIESADRAVGLMPNTSRQECLEMMRTAASLSVR